MSSAISVVTPTLGRPQEVEDLLTNLAEQSHPPSELLLIDASPDHETAAIVTARAPELPFPCRYHRAVGGTAIQRNVGIDHSTGSYIAFIDDDIRLEPHFFRLIMDAFAEDADGRIGGIAGYINNQHLDPTTSPRWRWYRRLHLFSTYEPGRYDYETGYPINRYLQPPHEELRGIDFMGAGCAVWRQQVFADGLRFSEFFRDFGVLEDAHLALRAGRQWSLLEHGQARCIHLKSQRSRVASRQIARKSAVNYRYVFVDIVPHRSFRQELRFWLVQWVDAFRMTAWAVRHPSSEAWSTVIGKLEGIFQARAVEAKAQS